MNRIRERRLELGMKQTELSAILREADPRIDTAMISRFECGVCLPTEPVLEALESAMQTDRAALYDPDELAAIEALTPEDTLQTSSPWTERLAAAIPYGRENAISRRLLAQSVGLSDRKLRLMIEQARGEGLLILNDQDGRGYWQSDDLAELKRQYDQDRHRALSVLYRLKAMRRILKEGGLEV